MINLCAPALIYVAFSLTQVIIDTFKGLYNTAFLKIIVMIIITILLNALCLSGMSVISWIIVFVPFIFMTVIVTILLYIFGLDPATGKLSTTTNVVTTDNKSNKSSANAKKYVDTTYAETPADQTETLDRVAPFWTTDPRFE